MLATTANSICLKKNVLAQLSVCIGSEQCVGLFFKSHNGNFDCSVLLVLMYWSFQVCLPLWGLRMDTQQRYLKFKTSFRRMKRPFCSSTSCGLPRRFSQSGQILQSYSRIYKSHWTAKEGNQKTKKRWRFYWQILWQDFSTPSSLSSFPAPPSIPPPHQDGAHFPLPKL